MGSGGLPGSGGVPGSGDMARGRSGPAPTTVPPGLTHSSGESAVTSSMTPDATISLTQRSEGGQRQHELPATQPAPPGAGPTLPPALTVVDPSGEPPTAGAAGAPEVSATASGVPQGTGHARTPSVGGGKSNVPPTPSRLKHSSSATAIAGDGGVSSPGAGTEAEAGASRSRFSQPQDGGGPLSPQAGLPSGLSASGKKSSLGQMGGVESPRPSLGGLAPRAGAGAAEAPASPRTSTAMLSASRLSAGGRTPLPPAGHAAKFSLGGDDAILAAMAAMTCDDGNDGDVESEVVAAASADAQAEAAFYPPQNHPPPVPPQPSPGGPGGAPRAPARVVVKSASAHASASKVDDVPTQAMAGLLAEDVLRDMGVTRQNSDRQMDSTQRQASRAAAQELLAHSSNSFTAHHPLLVIKAGSSAAGHKRGGSLATESMPMAAAAAAAATKAATTGSGTASKYALLKQAQAAGMGGSGVGPDPTQPSPAQTLRVQRFHQDGTLQTTSMQARPLGRGSVQTTGRGRTSLMATAGKLLKGMDTLATPATALTLPEDAPVTHQVELHSKSLPRGSQPLHSSENVKFVGEAAGDSTVFSLDAPPEGYRGSQTAAAGTGMEGTIGVSGTGRPMGRSSMQTGGLLGRTSVGARFFQMEAAEMGGMGGGQSVMRPLGAQSTSAAFQGMGGHLGHTRSLGRYSMNLGRGSAKYGGNAAFSHGVEEDVEEQQDRPQLVIADAPDLARSSRNGGIIARNIARISHLTSAARATLQHHARSGVSQGGASARDAEDPSGHGTQHDEHLLTEYRMRLLMGLKQYFKAKFNEGILSAHAYKTLSFVTSHAHHGAHLPLHLWHVAKKEVSSSAVLQWEAAIYYRLKQWTTRCKRSSNWFVSKILARVLVAPSWCLSWHMNQVTLAGLETAVELWISLTSSLQTTWLEFSGPYGGMILDEVNENAEAAWSFIVDRRIEAPEKFTAIQTYRASVSLLSAQVAFVQEMSHGGMVDELESRRMMDIMQRRLQAVCRRGPRWRRPQVGEILSALPFLRGVHPRVVEWLRTNSHMRVHGQGECIWEHWGSDAPVPGMFIVLSGVVRALLLVDGQLMPTYLGAGGVGGLISVVLDDAVSGMGLRAAYAEGNALGKGPAVLHIPRDVIESIKRLSRDAASPTFQQLELNLHRTAAAYVLDLLKEQVVGQMAAFVRGAMASVLAPAHANRHGDSKVAKRQRLRALLREAASGTEGGPGEGGGNTQSAVDHLNWIAELLEQPASAALALLEGNFPGHTSLPWYDAMAKAIAAATGGVYDTIKAAVRESVLVVLAPGQRIVQTSTMVLIQGSLKSIGDETFPSFSLPSDAPPAVIDTNPPAGPLGTVVEADDRGSKPTPQPSAVDHQVTKTLETRSLELRSLEKRSTGAKDLERRSRGLPSLGRTSTELKGLERRSLERVSLGARSSNTGGRSDGEVEQVYHMGRHGLARTSRGNGLARTSRGNGVRSSDGTRFTDPLTGHFIATHNEDHVAPSVMVWTADYFDVEVPTTAPIPIRAGSRGATLLVWGVDPHSLQA